MGAGQLLLAIIDGYPDVSDVTSATWQRRRLRRLRQARKALILDDGATDSPDDEVEALKIMAVWHHRETQLQSMREQDPACYPTVKFRKPRSFRKLAQDASIKMKGAEHSDFIEKIRKQFSESQEYFKNLINESDDIELMREFNALQKALDGLAKLGFRVVRPAR